MTLSTIIPKNPDHAALMEQAVGWKEFDNTRLLVEAMEIMLRAIVPAGESIGGDTSSQRAARLMQIELKRRISNGKPQEQIYKESLEQILHNAEKLMPKYTSEKALLDYMKVTKNPVLNKMYAIRQHCRATLGIVSEDSIDTGPETA